MKPPTDSGHHKEVIVRRSVRVAYAVAALFALVAIVALMLRPIHFERTLALGIVLAFAATVFGYWRSQRA